MSKDRIIFNFEETETMSDVIEITRSILSKDEVEILEGILKKMWMLNGKENQ